MKKSLLIAALTVFALSAPSLSQAADAAKGAKVFNKCKACHVVDTLKKKIGPSLNGVVGRKAGTREGFKYSKGMKAASEGGLMWDEATLSTFLTKPRALVKGTSMSFPGIKKEDQRADLIAYLKSIPVVK